MDLLEIERYYDTVPRVAARTEEVGPFTLFVKDGSTTWDFYARPRLGQQEFTADDVRRVLARQTELDLSPSIEWVDEVTPTLLPAVREALEDSGELELCPLLVLPVDRPVSAPSTVRCVALAPDSPDLALAVGTVGAAFEGIVLGIPAIAVSQQSMAGTLDYRGMGGFDFTLAARFTARLAADLEDRPLPERTLLNINVPYRRPVGVEVTRLGRRIYDDELQLLEREGPRRTYRIYGTQPGHADEPGTDLSAVAAGRIAVTPIHLDLTDRGGLKDLAQRGLDELLEATGT